MLNINDALALYLTLYEYLPDNPEEISNLDYIRGIIKNIKNEDPQAYVNSIKIMYNLKMKDIKEHSTEELLTMFIDGLEENKFFSLCGFLGSFGYGKSTSR